VLRVEQNFWVQRLVGNGITPDWPESRGFQKDEGVEQPLGKRRLKPMIAMNSFRLGWVRLQG